MPETSDLPYRPCVGVALFNSRGEVFAGRRIGQEDAHAWQMPQGGIGEDEDAETAALRELEEETGVRSARVLDQIGEWLYYDLPPDRVSKALQGRYRGQKQRWFAMRFTGDDTEIRLDADDKPEFSEWRWAPLADLPGLIVPFKRGVYQTVAAAFAPLAASIAAETPSGGVEQ
ncbi:MAG: RNA pyrophosphohydrolase [Rhodospirillales bacterium]